MSKLIQRELYSLTVKYENQLISGQNYLADISHDDPRHERLETEIAELQSAYAELTELIGLENLP